MLLYTILMQSPATCGSPFVTVESVDVWTKVEYEDVGIAECSAIELMGGCNAHLK